VPNGARTFLCIIWSGNSGPWPTAQAGYFPFISISGRKLPFSLILKFKNKIPTTLLSSPLPRKLNFSIFSSAGNSDLASILEKVINGGKLGGKLYGKIFGKPSER
jgi:hypothetical protein